jgi:CRISPR-associated endonuclease/helicase Cas3
LGKNIQAYRHADFGVIIQMKAYAHTRPDRPCEEWDPLLTHLAVTAEQTRDFARAFAPLAGYLVGWWHDLGKFRPEFQEYLRKSANAGTRDEPLTRYEHAIVGAYHAHLRHRSDLALAIAAHHGRLHDLSRFVSGEVDRAAKINCPVPPELLQFRQLESAPVEAQALWIRFLFSALVDADSLQTELWDKGSPRWRDRSTIPELLAKLESHIATVLAKRDPSPIDPLRKDVQRSCRDRAMDPPGAFRLTVPTGGGKTLASLLFALHHAAKHNLRRIIVVIPYTSIIEQTVATFRAIFGEDAVLEHHSNLDPEAETLKNRHCVENWDSPIVVTTSVQFFETLHANDKKTLRKLHNVAESVVILDEVQTFPIKLVKPIKDALRRLNEHFAITTVHCSATQPLLVQGAATEIVPDPAALFEISKKRVTVHWDIEAPAEWDTLGAAIREHPRKQVLAIVHRKRDAIDLARAVGDDCIHLSALMCPLHRKAILGEIRVRLDDGRPCLVVSTQLVEAGVDIDFPVVYRALAGIDSLAQAAGRCNREGNQSERGEFNVFLAPSDPPAGTLREGQKILSKRLKRQRVCLFDPSEYAYYFKELAFRVKADPETAKIPAYEADCNFPEVDRLFNMIEDEGTPVIAPYGADWLKHVRACQDDPSNRTFRALQPYTVSLRKAALDALKATGYLNKLTPDSENAWCVLPGHEDIYSDRFGFGGNGIDGLAFLDA